MAVVACKDLSLDIISIRTSLKVILILQGKHVNLTQTRCAIRSVCALFGGGFHYVRWQKYAFTFASSDVKADIISHGIGEGVTWNEP